MSVLLVALGLIVLVVLCIGLGLSRQIVFEYERGLLFRNGVLKRTLAPGAHWYIPFRSSIQKVDVRLKTVSIPSQEILSSDNITLKVTLSAQYSVTDPVIALTKIEKFQDAFYMTLQLALRELVGAAKVDEVIAGRQAIGKNIFDRTATKVTEYGLTLHAVDVKDIMFPGDLKKIFAQVVKAQKEGLAILEKARGETAALRHLANAAKMLDNNPALMQLRVLQSLEQGGGNTIVLGWPAQTTPLPIGKKEQPVAEDVEANESV